MKEFKAKTTIQGTPEKIWSVLTDVSRWPEWDPYCERVVGDVKLGSKLKAYSKLSPGRAFPVKVTDLSAPRRMVWSGGMPFGLFRGDRSYTLVALEDGSVEFTLHEVFTGPLLHVIGKSIPDMSDSFEKFVSGLKTRVEEK